MVARQSGDYDIDVIVKRDFDQSGGAILKKLNVGGSGGLWGAQSGVCSWGATSVVRGRLKFSGKFNSVQVGFRNQYAGQSFSIEGFDHASRHHPVH